VFDAEGVTNVVWVMTYMSLPRWDCLVGDLWPGDDLIDWLAYDPYSADGSTRSVTRFANVLAAKSDPTHHFTDKPLMLGEYGVNIKPRSTDGTVRAAARQRAHAYYDNMAALLHNRTIPNLKALVVFDSKTGTNNTNFGVGVDAWGTDDPAEQAAFNRLAASPAFLSSPAQ
jgi:hypothetical protein